MESIQILLIVVGLIIIFVGCLISEKVSSGNNTEEMPVVDEKFVARILEENEQQLKESAHGILSEKMEEELNQVDDKLSHISNEKIMAVSEFSDQLLEKIEQNHKEVVFLYDMLNEKENEMKDFVQEIDKAKVVLEEIANKELEKQKMLQHKRIQKELEKQLKKEEEMEKQKNDLLISGVLPKEETVETVSQEEPERPVVTQMSALERMGAEIEETPEKEEVLPEASVVKEPVEDMVQKNEGNQNQVILDLYNEG